MPLGDLGGMLGLLQEMSPNFHMQNALFHYIFAGDAGKIIRSLMILGAMTILMFAATFVAGKRRVK